MTDLTAGTDLCFPKSNGTSPHLLLFGVLTFGSHPELVSLQTTPNKHGDISPSLTAVVTLLLLELHCPVPINTGTSPLPSAAVVTLLLL